MSLSTTGSPKNKVFASATYEQGRLGATRTLHAFRAGIALDFNFDGCDEGAYFFVFRPKSVVDSILAYRSAKGMLLAAGVRNLFNTLGDNVSQPASNAHSLVEFASIADCNAYFLQKYGTPN